MLLGAACKGRHFLSERAAIFGSWFPLAYFEFAVLEGRSTFARRLLRPARKRRRACNCASNGEKTELEEDARTTKAATPGTVLEALPNAMFKVEMADGQKLLCHLPSRTSMKLVRVMPGDKVLVESSPYDSSRGRIVG